MYLLNSDRETPKPSIGSKIPLSTAANSNGSLATVVNTVSGLSADSRSLQELLLEEVELASLPHGEQLLEIVKELDPGYELNSKLSDVTLTALEQVYRRGNDGWAIHSSELYASAQKMSSTHQAEVARGYALAELELSSIDAITGRAIHRAIRDFCIGDYSRFQVSVPHPSGFDSWSWRELEEYLLSGLRFYEMLKEAGGTSVKISMFAGDESVYMSYGIDPKLLMIGWRAISKSKSNRRHKALVAEMNRAMEGNQARAQLARRYYDSKPQLGLSDSEILEVQKALSASFKQSLDLNSAGLSFLRPGVSFYNFQDHPLFLGGPREKGYAGYIVRCQSCRSPVDIEIVVLPSSPDFAAQGLRNVVRDRKAEQDMVNLLNEVHSRKCGDTRVVSSRTASE